MLSIVKSVNEIERLEGMNRAAMFSYGEALRAAGEYPIEAVPSETELYRAHIEGLRGRLAGVSEPDGFEIIHTSFRGELRLHRDKVNEWLTSMREELKAAAEAMQTLSIRVAENGSGHEERLKSDLRTLRSVVECEDLGRIRKTVQRVAAAIEESYEQLRDANQLLVVQLRDEIQSLHREMDNSRRSLFQDRATGAWNRQKLEARIEELLQLGDGFAALILWVSNLKRLEAGLPPSMIDGGLKAMVQRATASLGSNPHGTPPMLGRWANDQFLVLLEVDATTAVAMSNDLAQKLSSRYAVQYDGISHQITLHVATAVVDHTPGGDPRKLRSRLEQMTGVALGY